MTDEAENEAGPIAALVKAVGGPSAAATLCGVSRNTLLLWRKGVTRAPFDAVVLMARRAGLTLDDVVALGEPQHRPFGKPVGSEKNGGFFAKATENRVAPARSAADARDAMAHTSPPPGVASIALVDARAAAGGGAWNLHSAEIGRIPFPLEWLTKLGATWPDRCDFIRAIGDSMEPTIATEALMLIDRDQTTPPKGRRGRRKRDDDIFVFMLGDELRVKRLSEVEMTPRGRRFAVVSDNAAAYPVEVLSIDESARVKVFGRVIWWDNRL